jgi:hypothetical protein
MCTLIISATKQRLDWLTAFRFYDYQPDPAEKGRFQNEIDECKKLLMDRDRTKVGEKREVKHLTP